MTKAPRLSPPEIQFHSGQEVETPALFRHTFREARSGSGVAVCVCVCARGDPIELMFVASVEGGFISEYNVM